MIAISAGARSDTKAFVARYFGRAPVDVYVDASGSAGAAFRVASHPEFRFVSATGTLTPRVPTGFPFR